MSAPKTKKCKKCRKAKTIDCFSIDTRGGRVGKRMARCKPCVKEDKAEQHKNRKEKERAAQKESTKWPRVDYRPFPVDRYPAWLCPGVNG